MVRFKSIKRWLSLALCLTLCLLLLPGGAAAADTALTLSFQPRGNPAAGVEFRVYQVGEWDGQGGFTWTDKLDQYNINWDDLENLAATLEPYAKDLGEPWTAKTGQDGKATFSGLGTGAFLVMGDKYVSSRYTYNPKPVLISLPSAGKNQVSANVKYEEDYDSPGGGKTSVKVQKVWADTDHQDQRPSEVAVQLLRNGQVHDTVTLNADNNWRHTWTGLSKSADWQVVEKAVPDGYTVSVSKDGATFTVINTYRPPDEPDKPDEPDNPNKPDNPDEPDKPDEPDQPDTPGTTDTPGEPEKGPDKKPEKETLPQTGMLWWPVPVLAVGGMGCFLAGWVKDRKEKGHGE